MPIAISADLHLLASRSLVTFDLRDQRQDAALAVVVGAHDEEDELDRDDQRDRPEDERDDAEDVLFGRLHRAVVGGEDGLQRVERAGADVAEDDAERAERERGHAELAAGVASAWRRSPCRRNLAMGSSATGDRARWRTRREHCADVVGPVEDLGVGEAQGAEAGPRVGLVATEVDRLLGGGPVMAEAVGLDDEAEVGPEEVDAVAAEAALRRRAEAGRRRGRSRGSGARARSPRG